jgi:chromosome segregation ATPase
LEQYHTKVLTLEAEQRQLQEALSYMTQQQSQLETSLSALQSHLKQQQEASIPKIPGDCQSFGNSETLTGGTEGGGPRAQLYQDLNDLKEELLLLQSDLVKVSQHAIATTASNLSTSISSTAAASTNSPDELALLDTLRAHRESLLWLDSATKELSRQFHPDVSQT